MKLNDIKITPLLDTLRLEDISDEEYFSEKYSDYVSNSRLSLINPEQGGSPEDYFITKPKEYSDSLILGSAVHGLILQPDDYVLVEGVNRPTAKAGYMADFLYNKGKVPTDEEIIHASDVIDYYKGKMNDKKIADLKDKSLEYWKTRAIWEDRNKEELRTPIFLDEKKRDTVKGMVKAFTSFKDFTNLLNPSYLVEKPHSGNEKTILLDVIAEVPDFKPITLRLKSKLDNYILDTESNKVIVNDIKTTSKPVNWFKSAFTKYHYYRELGMYSWLIKLAAEKFYDFKNPKSEANCLVIETFPEYNSIVYNVSANEIMHGFNEFKVLLKLVAYYTAKGYDVSRT